MPEFTPKPDQGRNKAFKATHDTLIDVAVRLISEKGVEALSLAEVAREAGVNRTTVYYHFSDRDALIAAVRAWSADQLAKAFVLVGSHVDRANCITRFVLENPELIGLWIEDFVSPGDIRQRYPEWDRLVAGVAQQLADEGREGEVDPELYCLNMLTVAMIGPRIYCNSVRPDLDMEDAIERFNAEQMRMLRHDGFG